MKTIFFDLDGTLLDCTDRLYYLFLDILSNPQISKQQYWKLRRNDVRQKDIVSKICPEYDYEQFRYQWITKIETDYYLSLDRKFYFTDNLLSKISNYNLYLVTARQSKKNLLKELQQLQMDHYFKDILVTEQKKTKYELISNISFDRSDFFIGDTYEDIETGKRAGLITIAVSSGFLSKSILETKKPDFIIDQAYDLVHILY